MVAPSTFLAWFIIFSSSLLASTSCCQMFSGASNLQQGNVHVIAELLAPNVHVVSDDDSGDHIDNEVRAD